MSEPQPIETAPKDGTHILAWIEHNPALGHAPSYAHWAVARWIDHNGGGWTWNGVAGSPTLWLPLPPDPPLHKRPDIYSSPECDT